MKKVYITLFLAVLFFNLCGYYLMFIGLQFRADQKMQERLDAGRIDLRQSILVKVPFYLPYQPDMKDYLPATGELTRDGKHYNAVMRKIYRDTIYTVYVQNTYKNRLYRKLNDVVGLFTNVPLSHSKNSHVWDNLLKEYLPLKGPTWLLHPRKSRQVMLPHTAPPLAFLARAVPTPPPRSKG